jgi:asparagine synthase (glutamine-hydrolysing)
MNVGFTVFARHGEAEFHLRDHGHADRPALVTQAEIAGVRLVLMGRLYYRSDLRVGLDLAAGGPCNRAQDCDAVLALAVYRQRGLEGLEHLEGDFTLVIWDAGEQRLICMRDPTGGYPFFRTVHEGGVVASTRMGPLLDARASRTLNLEYLADYLMSPGLPLEDTADGRTVYQGIQRVLPGSIVVFHLTSGRVEQRRYWDWLQHQVDPGTDDIAKLGEQYLDLLRGAVRTRLRGRTASHLSGGMDSTSVALIARDCLQGSEPLHTLSLVYHRLPLLARERPYLESALGQPGLTQHRINGDEVLDFDRLDTAPAHDEPCPGLVRACASGQALTAAAAQAGAATIMTGIGSDDIFNMQPFHLTELLRSGRLWSAWSEASRWARARRLNDQLEHEVEIIERAQPAEVRGHFDLVRRWRIMLSDRDAWSFGILELLIFGAMAAALVRTCGRPGVDAGTIFAVLGYVLMYVIGITNVPLLVQQFNRLRDIGGRLQSELPPGKEPHT